MSLTKGPSDSDTDHRTLAYPVPMSGTCVKSLGVQGPVGVLSSRSSSAGIGWQCQAAPIADNDGCAAT